MKLISIQEKLPPLEEVILVYVPESGYELFYLGDANAEKREKAKRNKRMKSELYDKPLYEWHSLCCRPPLEFEYVSHWMPLPKEPR